MQFLIARDYTPIQTPYLMKKKAMSAVAQQTDYDEELYKVTGKWMSDKQQQEGDDSEAKYLIATSEQPMAAMYSDEFLELKDGPLKYAGFSTCFRQEAGSHGKYFSHQFSFRSQNFYFRDTRGIFRVHQFNYVPFFLFRSLFMLA